MFRNIRRARHSACPLLPTPKRSSQPHSPVRVARCVGPFPSTSLRDRVCVIGRADDHSTSEIAGTVLIGQTASGFCKPPATREGVSGRSCFSIHPPRPTSPACACLGSCRTRAGRGFPEAFFPSTTGAPNLQHAGSRVETASAITEHNQTLLQGKLTMFLPLEPSVQVLCTYNCCTALVKETRAGKPCVAKLSRPTCAVGVACSLLFSATSLLLVGRLLLTPEGYIR